MGRLSGFQPLSRPRPDQKGAPAPSLVQFSYIKGNLFRVVHADGVIGSVTPRAQLFLSIYSERAVIPRVLVHEVSESSEGDELGKVVHTETRGGYVRELEVGIMLDREIAIDLRDWLTQRIREMKQVSRDISKVGLPGDSAAHNRAEPNK